MCCEETFSFILSQTNFRVDYYLPAVIWLGYLIRCPARQRIGKNLLALTLSLRVCFIISGRQYLLRTASILTGDSWSIAWVMLFVAFLSFTVPVVLKKENSSSCQHQLGRDSQWQALRMRSL